jgi:hypothetical protein
MKQQTLTGFEKYGKTTRRAKLLADMDPCSGGEPARPRAGYQGQSRHDRRRSIISAPSSAKNKSGERDPEMHQTAKRSG